MAQFRTSADLLDSILRRAGETTNGNSDLEADALEYLNRIHHTIIAGGNEFDVEVDEPWLWARAKNPMVIELQPKYGTGTVLLTLGSEVGAFSAAPAISLEGYFIQCEGRETIYRIAQHTAASTAFEIDGLYAEATGATQNYKAFKLDYDLVPSHLIIDSTNNKIDFIKTGTTEITTTLTAGVYTPAALATHIGTAMTTSASGPTITCTYSALSRKFTLASDLAGGTIFTLSFAAGTNVKYSAHRILGFDDEAQSAAGTYEGAYILGGISRMIEPIRIHGRADGDGNIQSLDPLTMQRESPLPLTTEGLPLRFAKISENHEGRVTVRFDKYPADKTRIEIEYIAVPRDIKDNTASIPLIPRKFSEVLEYGTAYYLLIDKEDGKAQQYAALAKAKLSAMRRQNRAELERTSLDFGEIMPRPDLVMNKRRKRLLYGEPEDN